MLLRRQLEPANATAASNGTENPFSVLTPVQQPFEMLPRPPPLPINAIKSSFIERLAQVQVKPYVDRILDVFRNAENSTTATNSSVSANTSVTSGATTQSSASLAALTRRQTSTADPPPNCDANTPCVDGSCCNPHVGCGYGSLYCATANCTSNCK